MMEVCLCGGCSVRIEKHDIRIHVVDSYNSWTATLQDSEHETVEGATSQQPKQAIFAARQLFVGPAQ